MAFPTIRQEQPAHDLTTWPKRVWRQGAAAVLLGALLVACGATGSTGTSTTTSVDPLTFQATTIPVAYVGETYSTSVAVAGGVGPYGYRLINGALPPGMSMSSGTLSGTPTTEGTYKFSVEANDANLSNKVQQYTLNVNKLPDLSLELTLPSGEIRGETRVPVLIQAPRKVRAARFQWDVGQNVTVTRVQADSGNIMFWKQDGGILTVDLGFKSIPRSGSRVALVSVKPKSPINLTSRAFAFESRDGGGKLLSEKKLPAPPPPPVDPTKPAGTATPPASATPATPDPAKKPTDPGNSSPANPSPGNTSAPSTPGTATPTPATETPQPATPGSSDSTATPTTPSNTTPTSPNPTTSPTDGSTK